MYCANEAGQKNAQGVFIFRPAILMLALRAMPLTVKIIRPLVHIETIYEFEYPALFITVSTHTMSERRANSANGS